MFLPVLNEWHDIISGEFVYFPKTPAGSSDDEAIEVIPT
jgi:hypothetical protein